MDFSKLGKKIAGDTDGEASADDLMAEVPSPKSVAAFENAISGCTSMTCALEAIALALESVGDHVAASLVRGVRPDMSDHESSTM
jgi:hypothetical protein